ncbi:MAG: hypothetical protein J7L61_02495 [Thermoplasmata archaeon]|nr:hypothetical protein [Thermoplasmata archaeon]
MKAKDDVLDGVDENDYSYRVGRPRILSTTQRLVIFNVYCGILVAKLIFDSVVMGWPAMSPFLIGALALGVFMVVGDATLAALDGIPIAPRGWKTAWKDTEILSSSKTAARREGRRAPLGSPLLSKQIIIRNAI